MNRKTKTPKENEMDDIIVVDEEEILESELADPKARAEWDEAAPARALANMVIDIRAQQKLTQKQLAEKLQMTQPQISRLESGEHVPELKTLILEQKQTSLARVGLFLFEYLLLTLFLASLNKIRNNNIKKNYKH